MNYLIPQKLTSMPSLYKTIYNEYNTALVTVSHLQNELVIAQKALKTIQTENESLKTMVMDLQNRLLASKKPSEGPISQKIEETKPSQNILETKEDKACSKIRDFSINIKEEEPILQETQSTEAFERSIEERSDFSSPSLVIKFEEELESEEDDDGDEEYTTKRLPIRRRNGFKKGKGKANEKNNKDKSQQRSRAKHLWITYGRKIIDYALENSQGPLYEKIKNCHKLTSKRGYSEVFMERNTDTPSEKDFKSQFVKLALAFVSTDVENAFLGSNYREELLSQKEKVKSWIERQMNKEQFE